MPDWFAIWSDACDVRRELGNAVAYLRRVENFFRAEDQAVQQRIESEIERSHPSDEYDILQSWAGELHDNQFLFPDILRRSMVVALHQVLMSGLCAIASTLHTAWDLKTRLDTSGSVLRRAHAYLSDHAGFDLSPVDSEWSLLENVNSLRNSLVHEEGALPDDEDASLNVFVRECDALRGEPGGTVQIRPEFVELFADTADRFLEHVEREVLRVGRAREAVQGAGSNGGSTRS
jgi:hypothetical protein